MTEPTRRQGLSGARPAPTLWVGQHRLLVRLLLAVWGVAVIVLLFRTMFGPPAHASLIVVGVLSLITWAAVLFTMGFSAPKAADRWWAEHPSEPDSRRSD